MIGLSMLGQTTQAGMHGMPIFKKAGYDLVAFHANGTGGRALEACAENGDFVAVWKLTPHEIGDEMFSKVHAAGPDRIKNAAEKGISILLVPGCMDFFYGHRRLLEEYIPSRQTFDCNNETILIIQTRSLRIPAVHQRAGGGMSTIRQPKVHRRKF